MKKTSSLLLALALLASTSGCYCWPFYGGGGGRAGGGMGGYPFGCPPMQPTNQVVPTPVPATGYNTINTVPIAMPTATPIGVLPAPTPVVLETLPTFR
ncbi:MAG: hypothetical protein VB859_06115 [Planctomycetaceae bacterium]